MTNKFQGKYRIQSARLQNWDYSQNATYFITICTRDREHSFGTITDGKMTRSEIGEIAYNYWNKIPEHFPLVQLSGFVVMPNHIHGILMIKHTDLQHKVATELGVIINQYKRICTINARKIYPSFAWQSRFHDRIIRNDKSFHTISEYIENNPANWIDDTFY